MIGMNQLAGKILRKDAEVLMIFRVRGSYYPATDNNAKLFETYLLTGETYWLDGLDNELEF